MSVDTEGICDYPVFMRYHELKIRVRGDMSEAAQAVLIGAGFDSMQIDDSSVARDILDNPELYKYDYVNKEIADFAERAAEDVAITLYFTDDEEGRVECGRAADIVKRFGEENPGSEVTVDTADTGDDSEWLYKWQEHFRPTRIGERIVVKPGWEEYETEPEDLVIEMDPGMAFGSGLHETTSLCIKAMEKYIPQLQKALSGIKVLDVGTGTGILAIAAALLGAAGCLGIDIDDEAVRVASENVEKNGLGDAIAIAKGDLTEGIGGFEPDIIVANLMADLVIKLSPAAAKHLRPGGIYITSGILDIKEDVCVQAIRGAGFDIMEVRHDGEWCAVTARRR